MWEEKLHFDSKSTIRQKGPLGKSVKRVSTTYVTRRRMLLDANCDKRRSRGNRRRLFRNRPFQLQNTVNRFFNTIYFKGSNASLILPRKNRICLDGVDFVIVLE